MRRLSILALIFLLVGCSAVATKPSPVTQSTSPTVLMKQARTLHEQQRWQEAVDLLAKGGKQYPQELQIAQLRSEILRDWEMRKRNNEDWILVHETRALQAKIPYLQDLVAIDPENYITKSRLLFWQSLLESRIGGLIACGSVHLHLDQALAEACVRLAEKIRPTEESKHLLSKIKQSRAAQKRSERTEQAVREKRNIKQQRERLLKQAESQLSDDAIADAIATLNRLLELAPDDPAGTVLLEEAVRLRDIRVTRLIEFGDALYREEQIEQAVSVWESAEKLDMGRQDVAARIERAMKVLERLREIKKSK